MAEEDIKNLPPEERLAKLKEMEEKRKKELEETEKLIKESVEELQDKEKKKKEIPIEQVKALNLESLQTQEEKQMFKAKRFIQEKPDYVKEEEEEAEKKAEEKQEKEQADIPWPRPPDEVNLEQTIAKEEIPEQAAQQQAEYKVPGKDESPNLYMLAQEAAQNDTIDRIKGLEGRPYHEWDNEQKDFAKRMNYVADASRNKIEDMYHGKISDEVLDKVDDVKQEMERLRGDYIQ